ncbi:hypothetical protein [Rhodohalobacter sulfatireducens]|uniref:Uncharacterized protein n=1 Tax=Rhodohalobacter sulfatireducens TaxID=2911366 RepID=A0ABS9K8D2_9BACT|nr:hypothetical protein [Rhodohalobacter sulfatireducens]MCG2587112.1 hypothetical protein [Rhodohalobacter sulfatireducens]MDR9410180.1 hypothetical protein [Balneolaceae bacterium]
MLTKIKSPRFTFQITIDSQNIFLSMSPDKKRIRANITGIDPDQLEKIIDAVIDAGPEAMNIFKEMIGRKIMSGI